MSIKTSLTLAAAATALGLAGATLADSHGGDGHDGDGSGERALVILASDSLQTQGMAMILANAMQQQGAELSILLCDAAGDLAVEGYASPQPINTPPANPAGQVTPEGILQMLLDNGAQVDVCAIYLPNSDHAEDDLREGVGVAAPGQIAEMMRDPKIPVFSF